MNIKVKALNKFYGDKEVFKDFNIEFEENKVNCITGQSGCGKTTLLNIIAGLSTSDSGVIEGVEVKNISYIFQEDRLLDWLTVEENIELVLKKFYDKTLVKERCKKLLEFVALGEHGGVYPKHLSGGMRQRVNIARAFAKPSELIIMDEPFKSIDLKNKATIMKSFKKLIQEENKTVLFVTHELSEGIYFNDNLYVLGGEPVNILGAFKGNIEEHKEDIISLI